MKLIVGLGNPGRLYEKTRHNIGSLIVERLSEEFAVALKKEGSALVKSGKVKLADADVILSVPLTYMNSSGSAVAGLVKKHKIKFADLLVVCDDLDLGLGKLRLRAGAGSAGHRGVESIINSLASKGFARLRVGVGRPRSKKIVSDYVLSRFSKAEEKVINETIEQAVACCKEWLSQGMEKTMNKFNSRGKK